MYNKIHKSKRRDSMLISCPECGKEISDKSTKCIHCGYPLINNENSQNNCIINNTQYDLNEELQMMIDGVDIVHVIKALRMKCGISLSEAKRLYDIINETKEIPNVFQGDIIKTVVSQTNIPKCPTCGSNNIEKISTTKKLFGGAMFGLFSSDVRNTMHCKNCGYKW